MSKKTYFDFFFLDGASSSASVFLFLEILLLFLVPSVLSLPFPFNVAAFLAAPPFAAVLGSLFFTSAPYPASCQYSPSASVHSEAARSRLLRLLELGSPALRSASSCSRSPSCWLIWVAADPSWARSSTRIRSRSLLLLSRTPWLSWKPRDALTARGSMREIDAWLDCPRLTRKQD
jgi:hypothetical protein